MKRGYFVNGYDSSWGVAVVARTAKQAKNIAYRSNILMGEEWIDLRTRWMRNADVTSLEVGALYDLHEGLLRGLYMYIEGKCDECGEEAQLELCSGKALCFDCMEKDYEKMEREKEKRG